MKNLLFINYIVLLYCRVVLENTFDRSILKLDLFCTGYFGKHICPCLGIQKHKIHPEAQGMLCMYLRQQFLTHSLWARSSPPLKSFSVSRNFDIKI